MYNTQLPTSRTLRRRTTQLINHHYHQNRAPQSTNIKPCPNLRRHQHSSQDQLQQTRPRRPNSTKLNTSPTKKRPRTTTPSNIRTPQQTKPTITTHTSSRKYSHQTPTHNQASTNSPQRPTIRPKQPSPRQANNIIHRPSSQHTTGHTGNVRQRRHTKQSQNLYHNLYRSPQNHTQSTHTQHIPNPKRQPQQQTHLPPQTTAIQARQRSTNQNTSPHRPQRNHMSQQKPTTQRRQTQRTNKFLPNTQ